MQQDAAAGKNMPSDRAADELPGHAAHRHHDLLVAAHALQTWIHSRDVEAIAHGDVTQLSRVGLERSVPAAGLPPSPRATANTYLASKDAPDGLASGLFTLWMSPRALGLAALVLLIVTGWGIVARSSRAVSLPAIQTAGVGSLPPFVDAPVANAVSPTALPEAPEAAGGAGISSGLAGSPVIQTTGLDVIEALLLTLTTDAESWLQATVDGGEPRERLLPPGRTITFEGKEEVTLRVGNAAAVSLWINGQPARPLGREGQVVTLRITRETAQRLLLPPVS